MSPLVITSPYRTQLSYYQTVLQDSPVAYWRMGDLVGPTLTDDNATYNATLTGIHTLGAAGLIVGDPDTSVNFNGGYASVAHGSWATPTMSIEAWVKPTSVAGTQVILSMPFAPSGNCMEMGYSGGSWVGRVRTGGGVWTIGVGSPTPAIGTTYHVVLTTDGSNMYLYIDGVQNGPQPVAPGNVEINEGNIYIGAVSALGQTTFGDIDEAAVYLSTLSPTRVLAHYNAGI